MAKTKLECPACSRGEHGKHSVDYLHRDRGVTLCRCETCVGPIRGDVLAAQKNLKQNQRR